MEENTRSGVPEMNSLNKERKPQADPSRVQKRVTWARLPVYDSSSDSSRKKARIGTCATGSESCPRTEKAYDHGCRSDAAFTCPKNDATTKMKLLHLKTCTPVEPNIATSASYCSLESPNIGPHPLHARNLTKLSYKTVSEPLSISQAQTKGLSIYKHRLGSPADDYYGCLECQRDMHDIDYWTNKQLEGFLHSKQEPDRQFVLSSGRWSAGRDTQPTQTLTIDKEFEQYFAMLL